jgi:NitT/TauT family transport system ATP-binding protein
MTALINLNAVSKSFDGLSVIENISGELAHGEIISLVGPSGCGKSTLLRLVAGAIAPSDGTIQTRVKPEEVGFVFQDVRLLPWKSALENITFVLRNRLLAEWQQEAQARQALARVGLLDFKDYLPQKLSGGMQKRVAIARALAIDPKLLLFDEPFSDLDLPLRMLLIEDILRLLKDGGKTAIYVTHDIREALTLSDRIYLLSARPARILDVIDLSNLNGSKAVSLHSLEAQMLGLLQAETKKQMESLYKLNH